MQEVSAKPEPDSSTPTQETPAEAASHHDALSDMTRSEGKTSLWSIGTYLRIRPPAKVTADVVSYRIDTVAIESGAKRSIFDLNIPLDADPGLVHNNDSGKLRYEYDGVFDANRSNEDIFEEVAKDKVLDAMDGMNSTIFAYGQTGSGKTYTMFGGDSYAERGIIPHTISLLFDEIKAQRGAKHFTVEISFTEVYREAVYDLLDMSKRNLPIDQWQSAQVYENERGIVLKNVNVFEVRSEEEALNIFFMGNANRITESTAMNSVSSRSHAIFTVLVRSEAVVENRTLFTTGKINLVDLAGSERIYKMKNATGLITEAKSINLSLHFLEQVIVTLREAQNHARDGVRQSGHIPYRNSILTSLLRDSLGGNCRSSFILMLSPERLHFEETVSTCRFGQRCGEVKVSAHVNSEIGLGDQLRDLQVRVKHLERQINNVEDQKSKLGKTLDVERAKFHRMCDPRNLTSEEKQECQQCVQNLLNAAKESLNQSNRDESGELKDVDSSKSERQTSHPSPQSSNANILEYSREELYGRVEKMDKAVLIELSTALGSLVQAMYVEREKAKREEAQRQKRKAKIKADKEAKAKSDETQRRSEVSESDDVFEPLDGSTLREPSSTSSALTPAEVEMLREGDTFLKVSKIGFKQPRHVYLSEDLTVLCWKQEKSNKSASEEPLVNFLAVEVVEKRGDTISICLRGRNRSLELYPTAGSIRGSQMSNDTQGDLTEAVAGVGAEKRNAATRWATALQKCLKRVVQRTGGGGTKAKSMYF